MLSFRRHFIDLIGLLFPDFCCGCNRVLYCCETLLCISCLYDLPYTDHHLHADNQMARQFWGRVSCEAAMALLYFKKEGKVQELVHHLKYKNRPELGILLGKMMASRIGLSTLYQPVELVVPVPLYRKREQLRGYNQSTTLAQGIATILNIALSTENLCRVLETSTQTNKSRYQRFENMQEVFHVLTPEAFNGKHLLLIDDVSTTGATLEACTLKLLECNPASVRIATLAFTS